MNWSQTLKLDRSITTVSKTSASPSEASLWLLTHYLCRYPRVFPSGASLWLLTHYLCRYPWVFPSEASLWLLTQYLLLSLSVPIRGCLSVPISSLRAFCGCFSHMFPRFLRSWTYDYFVVSRSFSVSVELSDSGSPEKSSESSDDDDDDVSEVKLAPPHCKLTRTRPVLHPSY